MKIVCENCGAKYSIADEKVKGKVFKIRCKKCSESILVRGDTEQSASEPSQHDPTAAPDAGEEMEAETRVFDYAGYNQGGEDEAIWHIVVEDQQQGPYTPAQIKEYLQSGSLTADSLIWREGFEDWMVITDVPEFADARPAATGGGLFDDQPGNKLFDDQPAGGGLFGGHDAGGSPFDSGGGLFSGNADTTGNDVFSSAAPEQPAPGLFGDAGGSSALFGGKEEESADEGIFSSTRDNAAAVAGPRVSAEQAMMTGQRNENSVLFSLSNLQALAAGPSAENAQAAPGLGFASPTGAAGDEASGLIDIRALAGSISTAEQDNSVDDLISMGGGGFSPALGAPVLAAQNEGMSNVVKFSIIGGAVAILALVVVVLVVVLSGDDDAQTAAQAQIAALQKQIEALSQKGGSAENNAELAKLKEQLDAKKVEAAKASGDTKPASEKAASDDDNSAAKKPSAASSTSGKKRPSGSSGGGKSSGSSSASSSGSSSASSSAKEDDKPAPSRTKTSELDDLLGPSSGGKSNSSAKPKSSGGSSSGGGSLGPAPKASLSRSDVQDGMQAVAPAVKRCGQGTGGTITMAVTIGKTGRVSSASPTGAFAGTPVGNCAARAVRRAKFPASQQSLNVKYPFKL